MNRFVSQKILAKEASSPKQGCERKPGRRVEVFALQDFDATPN
jgi:hypothetical protein